MAPPIQLPPVKINAVVDTNVILDIYSCTNLYRLAETNDLTTKDFRYRAQRARDAILLAEVFDWQRFTTVSLDCEQLRNLAVVAPPDQMDDFPSGFTTIFIHFVKDYLLPSWNFQTSPGLDRDLLGDKCDDLLIDLAEAANCTLISNEGLSADGYDPAPKKKIPAKAQARGVEVVTSGQYLRRYIADPEPSAIAFLKKFDERREDYLDSRHTKDNREALDQALQYMHTYFTRVMFDDWRFYGPREAA